MSKFCSNCGTPMEDAVTICPNCNAYEPVPFRETAKPASKKKLIAAVCAIVVVVLAIVLICVLTGGNSYEDAIDNYVAALNGDVDDVEDLAPEEVGKIYLDYTTEKVKYVFEQAYAKTVAEYGNSVRIDLALIHAEEASPDVLSDFMTVWTQFYYGDPDDLEAVYILDLLPVVQNADGLKPKETDYAAVNIRGTWYLCIAEEVSGHTRFAFASHSALSQYIIQDSITHLDDLEDLLDDYLDVQE